MRITHTIAFRLFLLIVTIQAVVIAALTFATVRIQQSHLMDNVVLSANRVSDIIVRSTRYSMLLNRKEDVHSIIHSVGGEPGMEGLRIYNKEGEVIFATNPADIHTSVDLAAEACVSCHGSNGLNDVPATSKELSRIFTKSDGERILGLITPIRNEPQCSDAACHAHPPEKTILGVLDVKMSLAQVDAHLRESERQFIMLSVAAALLVSVISGGFILLVVHAPVRRLREGMAMVASGRLDMRVEATSENELGQLAGAFNSMTAELARAREENTQWSRTLELKVQQKTEELERAHKQMMRVEKMASLGNLAATVAHELNNPLEGILTFARLLIKRIKKSALTAEEIQPYTEDLTLVADEAQRSGNIVKNLLLFARQKGGSFQSSSIKAVVDRCALLMNHHARMHNVDLVIRCDNDVTIQCDPNQIQQALIALMVNAIEAMSGTTDRSEGGTLTVEVLKPDDDHIAIRVIDTGVGMTEEVKAHIFEPFFTTKSDMKGVGLGLAVVYGIVERHHGGIDVDSAPGKGTTFTITLPITQPAQSGQHKEAAPLEGTHS